MRLPTSGPTRTRDEPPSLSDGALDHLREMADWPDLGGRYEVVEALGRGGMGTVYRARDRELQRDVAVKVVSFLPGSEASGERLRREAQVLARLEHPGLVPVHDLGTLPDGRLFYVMKLVRGERLSEHVSGLRSVPALLRLFERICEAVAFAHDQGVIHRDLKPENVMLGPFGEVLVMDWGVAKVLAEMEAAEIPAPDGPSLTTRRGTAAGTVLGTPGYMAPEQAAGRGHEADARADVYALGAILHFLLAGEPPIPVVQGSPPSSVWTVPVGRPLAAIVRKALATEPLARYPGASELAADVSRYLSGLAVAAYPERLPQRLRRWAIRYRTPLMLVLAYLLMRALLVLFGGR